MILPCSISRPGAVSQRTSSPHLPPPTRAMVRIVNKALGLPRLRLELPGQQPYELAANGQERLRCH